MIQLAGGKKPAPNANLIFLFLLTAGFLSKRVSPCPLRDLNPGHKLERLGSLTGLDERGMPKQFLNLCDLKISNQLVNNLF